MVKIWTNDVEGFQLQIGNVKYQRKFRRYIDALEFVRAERAARIEAMDAEWTGPRDPYEPWGGVK